MALHSGTTWDIRTTGSDTNGGGFSPTIAGHGTDYSQQNAPQISVSNLTCPNTTTVTSAGASFTSALIGNVAYLTGGGATTGWYQITAVPSGTTLTLDRAPGTVASGTMNIGGALASPSLLSSLVVAGNSAYIKSGTYTMSSASTGVSNGVVSIPVLISVLIYGYETTHGDNCPTNNRPVMQAGANSLLMWTAGAVVHTYNICCDGGKGTYTGVTCFTPNGQCRFINCVAQNSTGNGFASSASAVNWYINCYATNVSIGYNGGNGANYFWGCVAKSCTSHGFFYAQGIYIQFCIAANNTGNGFNLTTASSFVGNCTAYGNTGDGFATSGNATRIGTWLNCLSVSNGGYGFNGGFTYNCATFGNTTAALNGVTIDTTCLALATNPFVNAAGGNFALNGSVGGGLTARGAGVPGAFADGVNQGYEDIGAAQHTTPTWFSAGWFKP